MILTLTSETFSVTITPERGADITQITDRATGLALLSVSPTAAVTTPSEYGGTTQARWTSGYPGGWQFLTPNAGAERERYGVVQGYHGESSLSRWTVLSQETDSATLTARLLTVPFELHRTLALIGGELIVRDSIRNLSDVPIAARLLQHPAFGAPFLDEHSYIVTDAGTLVTDAEASGSLVAANQEGAPNALLHAGPVEQSFRVPAPGSAESLFGALTDFAAEHPAVILASPTHGFGIELSWGREVYPVAWLWMEANATREWPWFGRMYAIAVEPGNLVPGVGVTPTGRERGGEGRTIGGGETVTSEVRLRRIALP